MNTRFPISPAPVILLANVFEQKFTDAIAAITMTTAADLSLSDGKMNPLDLFVAQLPNTRPAVHGAVPAGGIALVIINQLKSTLTGVNCLEDITGPIVSGGVCPTSGACMVAYPCATRTGRAGLWQPHQIPGRRPYPIPSLHGVGDPTNPDYWLSAVGVYLFESYVSLLSNRKGGVAFSLNADGSAPLFGVAFKQTSNSTISSAVTMELSAYGKATPEENLDALAEDGAKYSIWQVSDNNREIGASWAGETSGVGRGIKTLLVWVRHDPFAITPEEQDDLDAFNSLIP